MGNRKRIILVVLVIILYIIYKITLPYIATPSEIKDLNKNIDLPYNFAEEVSEEDFILLEKQGWVRSYIVYTGIAYTNDKDDLIIFSGYPDLSNRYKFTLFRTKVEGFSVFDISAGGNIDKVKINLKKKGYREKHIYGDYVFTKGKVVITLIPDIENEIIEYNI